MAEALGVLPGNSTHVFHAFAQQHISERSKKDYEKDEYVRFEM